MEPGLSSLVVPDSLVHAGPDGLSLDAPQLDGLDYDVGEQPRYDQSAFTKQSRGENINNNLTDSRPMSLTN